MIAAWVLGLSMAYLGDLWGQHWFHGKLLLLPKGDLEPYALPNRNTLERDYVYQLDRRVELRVYR